MEESEELLHMPLALDELSTSLILITAVTSVYWMINAPLAELQELCKVTLFMLGTGVMISNVFGGMRFKSLEQEAAPILYISVLGIAAIILIQTAIFAWAPAQVLPLQRAVLIVMLIGFAEEVFFRGGLLNAQFTMLKSWESEETLVYLIYPSIILNGIIFAFFHYTAMIYIFGKLNIFYLLAIMCSGMICAYVATVSRRLSYSMLTHGLFNALVVATKTSVIPL